MVAFTPSIERKKQNSLNIKVRSLLITFDFMTNPLYSEYSDWNDATLYNVPYPSFSAEYKKKVPLYHNIFTKSAKLLHIGNLTKNCVLHEEWIPEYEKLGWKTLRLNKYDGAQKLWVGFFDNSKTDVKGLTLDILIGKENIKTSKKILDELDKENITKEEKDSDLDNLAITGGDTGRFRVRPDTTLIAEMLDQLSVVPGEIEATPNTRVAATLNEFWALSPREQNDPDNDHIRPSAWLRADPLGSGMLSWTPSTPGGFERSQGIFGRWVRA